MNIEMLKEHGFFSFIWIILLASLVTSLFAALCLSANGQNMSPDELSSSVGTQKSTNNSKALCAESANQFIILGDLHLIQALKEMVNNNSSGALDELAFAEEQLTRGQRVRSC
jgi:hypothetical protein